MHSLPQGAAALAVDHPHAADALAEACREVLGKQLADLRRPEGMQVQLGGDGDAVRFLAHRDLLDSGKWRRSSTCLVFLPLQGGNVRLVLPPAVKMVAVVQW